MRTFLPSLCFVLGICLSFSTVRAQSGPDYRQLDTLVDQILADSLTPGISLVVFDDQQVLHQVHQGVRHLKTQKPVGPKTIFEAASLSKTVFAYLYLLEKDRAELGLNDKVDPLPDMPVLAADERFARVTPAMLLSHQSGLPNWRGRFDRTGETYSTQFKATDTLRLKQDPGTGFSYSGEGYLYLQRVLEGRTSENLEDLARRRLFSPLNMTRSSYIPEPRLESLLAQGYYRDGDSRPAAAARVPVSAASLITTSRDYAAFLQELLRQEDLLEEMANPLVPVDTLDGTLISWGLGLGVIDYEGDRYAFHWGDNPAFKAYYIISLSEKKGVVWLANSEEGLSFRNSLIRAVFVKDIPMWPTYYTQRLE